MEKTLRNSAYCGEREIRFEKIVPYLNQTQRHKSFMPAKLEGIVRV